MPYLQFDLDAFDAVTLAATATGLSEESIAYGLLKMWRHCWKGKKELVYEEIVIGCFGKNIVKELCTYGFLEPQNGALRVRGASRWMSIRKAQSDAGKAKTSNLRNQKDPKQLSARAEGEPRKEPRNTLGSTTALEVNSQQSTVNSQNSFFESINLVELGSSTPETRILVDSKTSNCEKGGAVEVSSGDEVRSPLVSDATVVAAGDDESSDSTNTSRAILEGAEEEEAEMAQEELVESNRDELIQNLTADEYNIFAIWQEACEHPRALATPARKKLIAKQLKLYTWQELRDAIIGCSESDFHMGRDSKNGYVKYNSLELILRNAEKIEFFTQIYRKNHKE